MSSSYERHRDVDDDEDLGTMNHTQIVYAQMRARGRHWPTAIGVTEILIGCMITLLGVAEVFIVPMVESEDGYSLIEFKEENCFGVGILAGLVMVLTGSTAIRASLSKRNTTVYRFFNLTIFSLLTYTIFTIILIVGFSQGWTTADRYEEGSSLREVHIFMTILTVMGLLFALTGFVGYFDVICCGDFPLWTMWAKCLCFCCYGQSPRKRLIFEQDFREELGHRSDPI